MITLFSGTPGSGKSYHACMRILQTLKKSKSGVISNFPVTLGSHRVAFDSRLSYWDNADITPGRLAAYARKYHTLGDEGQTLLVVDEAQIIWNARSFKDRDRLQWITFFSQHRKLGFDVLMIAQNDRMIDRQIRMLIEIEVRHRKINNYGVGGYFFTFFGLRSCFLALRFWYGGNKLLLSRDLIWFKKSVADIYDTMLMFDAVELQDDLGGLDYIESKSDTFVKSPDPPRLRRVLRKLQDGFQGLVSSPLDRDDGELEKQKILQDLLRVLQDRICCLEDDLDGKTDCTPPPPLRAAPAAPCRVAGWSLPPLCGQVDLPRDLSTGQKEGGGLGRKN